MATQTSLCWVRQKVRIGLYWWIWKIPMLFISKIVFNIFLFLTFLKKTYFFWYIYIHICIHLLFLVRIKHHITVNVGFLAENVCDRLVSKLRYDQVVFTYLLSHFMFLLISPFLCPPDTFKFISVTVLPSDQYPLIYQIRDTCLSIYWTISGSSFQLWKQVPVRKMWRALVSAFSASLSNIRLGNIKNKFWE